MLTPETIRAYQRQRFERLLMTRLGFSIPVRVPADVDDDDHALPTGYGQRERDYMNFQDDEPGQRDSLENIR